MPQRTMIRPSLLRRLAGAVLIFAVTLIAYAPALRAGFIWDDDAYVTQNPNLQTLEGLRDTWIHPRTLPQYYPLVHTSLWLEYKLAGLNPVIYHVNNVL